MNILKTENNTFVKDYTDVERKVASGEYALEKGVEVEVESPDGERGVIPSENAASAFQEGFKLITPEIKAREQKEKEYGEGLGPELKAGALGAARGISFGLSDQALTKLNLIKPEALKLYRDLNPASSLAGEITGAVGPALLSGGASLAGNVAAKTLPAVAMRAGAATTRGVAKKLTGKIASKTVDDIVAKAASVGAGSAVEGALYGTGQLVTEDALGDAEFSAENLINYAGEGALVGGVFGGGVQAIGSTAMAAVKPLKSKLDSTLLKKMGLKDKQIKDILDKQDSDEILLNLADEIKNKDYSNIVKAADHLGVTPTQGMLSGAPLVRELESSLAQAPTIAGQAVRKNVDAVLDQTTMRTEAVVNSVDPELLSRTNLSPFEAGELIKNDLIADIGERVSSAKVIYDEIYEKFGESLVSERMKTMLKNRLNKSDSKRLFKSGEVDKLNEIFDAIETVNDVSKVRSYIGKELQKARVAVDNNRVAILDDAYDTLTRMRKNAIIENSGNAKEVINGLTEADKIYASVFKDFSDVGKSLNIGKIRGISQLTEKLSSMESEKIAQRFFSKKNFSNNMALKEKFPASFDRARKVRMGEIWEKSQTNGEVSLKKFVNNLKKIGKEEQDLIFGADKRETLEAIETIVNSLPEKVGPSGTAQAQDLFNFFTVATQSRDAIRYMLYKNGETGIKKYLGETLGVLKKIETSNNKAKITISNSVDKFLKGAKPVLTVTEMNAGESRNYQKALEYMTDFEANPDKTIEDIAEKNKVIYENAPRTSEALSGKTLQIFQFLKEKTPNDYNGVATFNKYEPSKSQKSKFMRYYKYANNPSLVMRDISNGFITSEGIETLRTLYPKNYEVLYNEIIGRYEEKEKLSYSQKKALYKLLGVTGEAALIPQNLRQLQGNIEQAEQKKENNLRVTGLKNMGQDTRFQTKLDKATKKS